MRERERLGIDDNLGTTAKQVVMVWACDVKKMDTEMYGV